MVDETNTKPIDDTNPNAPAPNKGGKVKYCEKCKKQYDAVNQVCPFCGHKNKHTALKVTAGFLIGGTILFGALPDSDKEDDSSSVPDRAIVTEVDTTADATTEIEITTTKGTTTATTASSTTTTTTTATTTSTTTAATTTAPARKMLHFVLNTESNCVHINKNCSAAEQINPVNRQEIDIYEDDLSTYAGVYWACGKCSRRYRDILYPLSDD